MARRRRSRRYYRKKGRWSANINNINTTSEFNSVSSNFAYTVLQQNPAQSQLTVSQQYTVKNVEMTYEIETRLGVDGGAVENLQAYIIYLPQGMVVTETLPYNHPEYIMAYRWLGSPNIEVQTSNSNALTPGRNPLYIKTRLARKLQTGDSIIFLLIGDNTDTNSITVNIRGLVRYWTKAN